MSKNKIPMENKENLTPEQEAEELIAQEATNESDVRDNIITEYGFDEVDDADKIDKLVEKELDYSKKLSSAIGQKIKHREEAEELKAKLEDKTPEAKPKTDTKVDVEDLDKKLDEKLNERLDKKELEELDYSDDLKDEISKIAKLQDISIKKALSDPYIAFKVEEYNKEQKIDEATISRKPNSQGSKDYSIEKPPVVDLNTEEGRKEWDEYTKEMIARGN